MKKFLVALMALVMIFSLAACGGSPTDNSSQSVDDSSSSESATTPAPESSEDSESTAADYMNWTLSDWSSASLTEQSSLLIEILAEVDTDASAQDIGATLGLYLGQGKTVGDFINDAKADPSIIKGLDELTTAPSDYMDWTLADWSAASSEDQTATILTVISEIGVDASVQDIGASLGYYLGMGKTIGDFVNDAKADPSVVQSMDDIMADLEEDLSGLTE
ncbi:MAG: lipoprotein [Candidatus Pararuminococcus gallinarum]|jgi:hypothetical protein